MQSAITLQLRANKASVTTNTVPKQSESLHKNLAFTAGADAWLLFTSCQKTRYSINRCICSNQDRLGIL